MMTNTELKGLIAEAFHAGWDVTKEGNPHGNMTPDEFADDLLARWMERTKGRRTRATVTVQLDSRKSPNDTFIVKRIGRDMQTEAIGMGPTFESAMLSVLHQPRTIP